ncbi:hypothetical protein Ocin01_19878 [Orchesella cincta]|uniref:Uncharacterized protein n=1 Tax=Orchesella cincta TaxID=48709 RepID=A0A1D2M1H0_ORCCI|nr:hypothetical protein Ocin01_19878 [Orchesella cincta]
MQRSRTSLMMMIVCLVILPFLRIPLAEGIKCYECIGCQEHEGIVRDCLKDQVGDTCFEKVDLDSTYKRIDHYRGCVFSDRVESEKKKRDLFLVTLSTVGRSLDNWTFQTLLLLY